MDGLALATFMPAASARGFYRYFGEFAFGPAYYPWFCGRDPWYGPDYYILNAGELQIVTKHKSDPSAVRPKPLS
jgi:hypothetical protein